MHDLVIRGAEVHDGLGGAPRIADVAVDQGRITTIGLVSAGARQEVDARGLTLMPGIVDLHTHFMTTLSYQRGEWGKHFTTSCPKISIVLDHAQETTEVSD